MKIILTLISLIGFVVFGQDSLTLQSCLNKAQANKLLYASQSSLVRSSQVDRYFHTWTLIPNLGASTGFNTSFGRRLDPFTNTFATTSVNSQSIGLNSSVQLFNGLNYIHKRNILDATISKNELTVEVKQNDVKIQIIELYLGICKLSKQIKFAQVRIDKYKHIQNIQRLLINEGKINAIDTLKSHNSMMNESNLLINLQNEITLKMIDLNYLIGEPLLSKHSVDLNSVNEIIDKPKLTQYFVLAQLEIDQEIADYQLKVDRSTALPNLTLNGLLGTGFSTNNKDYTTAGTPTKPYRDQVNQNLYEGIGLYLSIPIFNRGAWIKSKQLYAIKNIERESAKEQTSVLLEKQKVELQQKKNKIIAEQDQTLQIANNLHTIYDKTVLLYQEGRTTYTELETAFMEWQTKLVALEALKLDNLLLMLYE